MSCECAAQAQTLLHLFRTDQLMSKGHDVTVCLVGKKPPRHMIIWWKTHDPILDEVCVSGLLVDTAAHSHLQYPLSVSWLTLMNPSYLLVCLFTSDEMSSTSCGDGPDFPARFTWLRLPVHLQHMWRLLHIRQILLSILYFSFNVFNVY